MNEIPIYVYIPDDVSVNVNLMFAHLTNHIIKNAVASKLCGPFVAIKKSNSDNDTRTHTHFSL